MSRITATGTGPTARPGNTGRPGWRLLVVVAAILLVVVGLVVADRVFLARTEARLAAEMAASFDLGTRPEVAVDGFPFLTQVVSGEIGSVRVDVADITFTTAAGELELRQVRAHAQDVGVRAPSTIGRLDIEGTLTDAAIETLVQQRVPGVSAQTDPDGVELTGDVLGLTLGLRAVPEVVGDAVDVRVVEARVAGVSVDLETVAGTLPASLLEMSIDVSDLPYGIRLTGAEPIDGGLRLAVTGEDLTLEE